MELEKDTIVLGLIGIEDVLQENVADTISFFREANQKFWMLTGDKPSTAIHTAIACHMITLKQKPLYILAKTRDEAQQ